MIAIRKIRMIRTPRPASCHLQQNRTLLHAFKSSKASTDQQTIMLIELIERCLLLVVVNICEDVVNVSNVKLKRRVLLIYLCEFCDNPKKKINLSPVKSLFCSRSSFRINCKLFSGDRLCILPHRDESSREAQSCTWCPMDVIVRTRSALTAQLSPSSGSG